MPIESVQTQRAPVQTSHLYNRHRVSFPRVKRPGRVANHPFQTNVEVKERVELYIYSSFGSLWAVLGWTSIITDSERLPYYESLLLVTVLLPVDLPQNNGLLRLSTSTISFCLTQNKMFPHYCVLYICVFRKSQVISRIIWKLYRLATGWTVQGSNPSGSEIFGTFTDRPWRPHSFLNKGYRVSFQGVKRPGRGVDQTTAPQLVSEFKKK